MLKRWFPVPSQGLTTPHNGRPGNGTGEPPPRDAGALPAAAIPHAPAAKAVMGKYPSFEEIYMGAAVKPPQFCYGILKVSEMAHSAHLAGMSTDSKRGALQMALEAAGVDTEDLVREAAARQRALNDFEEAQQDRLRQLEQARTEENRRTQAELDQLTARSRSRIQANLDEVAQERDHFRSWQARKQEECQRIGEAAKLCRRQTAAGDGGSAAAVAEWASRPLPGSG